jgi:hypothetical protein
MWLPIRLVGASACIVLCAGCNRLSEGKLVGTWRGENENAVDEIAFNHDHTLVWWNCGKKELSTPQTIVSAGEWHIQGNQIDIESKQLTWPTPLQHRKLQIMENSNDRLLLKDLKEATVVTYGRIEAPVCVASEPGATPYPLEPNIVGTWQVHYNTHDFKYRFAPDHTVAVSARDSGEFQPMWKGAWSVAGNNLIMDLKADWKYGRENQPNWTVYGFQPRCLRIKDPYGVSYIVHRVE